MPITVVGSIAFDTVETPFGRRERMVGGAATHFALAASFFDEVRVVGPVGDDFDAAALALLATRETNTDDVEHVAGGKSFFWAGEYGWDLNSRETLDTQLGVFETFQPKLSAASREADVLFLANIQPSLQRDVLDQGEGARFVALDSMNLWIDIARDDLVDVISRVDCLMLNDAELRQLTRKPSLVGAAREALTNAGKHGGAGRVTVFVEPHERGVFCSVKDDGLGFDPAVVAEGVGLSRSIRGRMEEAGGRVEVRASPGKGAEVTLWLP